MSSINEKPDQTLRKVAFDFKISHSSVKSIFKQNKLKFFKKSPLAPLTAEHKTARCNFTFQFISKSQNSMPIIIFSDESTFENIINNGIWRKPGEYPPGSFYPKDQKPLSVMIWGQLAPVGVDQK